MSDVFLLGAGFSKAIHPSMPLLGELSEALRERVNLPYYVTDLGDNIEYWMTYLSQPQPWVSEIGNLQNKAIFLELTREIDVLLHERTQDVRARSCPDWLNRLVRWWHDNRTHVITLNYDTLIERAAGPISIGTNSRLSTMHITPVRLVDIRRSFCGVSTMFLRSSFTSCMVRLIGTIPGRLPILGKQSTRHWCRDGTMLTLRQN